jgi:hypothetical protein
MEPAVDFAVHGPALRDAAAGPRKARRPAAPFPATRPRRVETAAAGPAVADVLILQGIDSGDIIETVHAR